MISLATGFFTLLVFTVGVLFAADTNRFARFPARKLSNVPPTVSSFIPFLGPYLLFWYKEPLWWARNISYNVQCQATCAEIWGRKFYIFSKQNFINHIFTHHAASFSFAPVRRYLLINIFGANRGQTEASAAAIEDALLSFKKFAMGEDLSRFTSKLVRLLQEDGTNLVSFSESVVDENLWERLSNPRVVLKKTDVERKEVDVAVEVDMFALIRNFVGLLTIRSLMGTDWEGFQCTFVEMLWIFDDGWQSMLLGLPRWLPIPGLSKAYIARRKLGNILASFHRTMDDHAAGKISASMIDDPEGVSQLFKDRCCLWRAHRTAESVKGSADLSLLWAAIVKPGNLIFWMLFHIYSEPTLVEAIRLELSPLIFVTQPPNVFNMSEPPRLTIRNVESLSDACPLTKAVFYECLRLYSKPVSFRKVTKTLSIPRDSLSNQLNPTIQRLEIKSGAYLMALFEAQGSESITQDCDDSFDVSRFLSVDHEGRQKCNDAAAQPWGMGEAACPGRHFAEKQTILFAAVIMSFWDIELPSLENMHTPKTNAQHVMARPKSDYRVLIRARKFPSEV